MTRTEASRVYFGWVRHRRFQPRPHSFRYPIAMPLIQLDQIDQFLSGSKFFGRKFWHPGRFCRRDFLGDPNIPLVQAVKDRVVESLGVRPDGPVYMLGHLRYFGICFNPVTFYYCYDKQEELVAIVAEITNTPWRERHAYVLDFRPHRKKAQFKFPKQFHVSPFIDMQRDYDWRFNQPAKRLLVHMNVSEDEAVEFDATMVMQERPATAAAMRKLLWNYPLQCVQVIFRIHWQALWLWLKGNPVYDHPSKRRAKPTEQ